MSLKIKNIHVEIEGKQVLRGVDLEVKKGEVVALMGPNGSGKSSLALALMGHPRYTVLDDKKSEISLDGESLIEMSPDERARAGLFLAFQYPVAISGVSVKEVMLTAMRERGMKKTALELRRELEKTAEELRVSDDLLKRSINDGFSGGEKKKMEVLQMRLLQPKYAVLDETDSGLDIDALKTVAQGARYLVDKGETGVLVITHYQRILRYLKPDRVIVLKEGKVVKEGGGEIVKELEKSGYQLIK